MRQFIIAMVFLRMIAAATYGQSAGWGDMDFPRVGDRNPREEAERTANRAEEARQRKARLEEEAKKAAENKATDPQGIRERAGEASKRYEASWERVRSSYGRMVADFDQMQTLSDHRDFNHIRSLHAFLTELRRLGEAVVDDEVAFRKAFDEFQRDSGQAVGHFEKASDYFHRLAEAAEFPETKSLYRTASTWYAARAEVSRRGNKAVLLTNYETEHRRLTEFVKSVRQLERMVEIDPSLLQQAPEGIQNLAAFQDYYSKLGEALRAHTQQMAEGLKQPNPNTPNTGNGRK